VAVEVGGIEIRNPLACLGRGRTKVAVALARMPCRVDGLGLGLRGVLAGARWLKRC
jgi:hypothetical protein